MTPLFRTYKTSALLPWIDLVLIFLLTTMPAAASDLPENPVEWHISAGTATYSQDRELYIAKDDVVITGGNTRLEADYLEFDNTSKQALAKGNVLLISGDDTISCQTMDINLVSKTGTIYNGTLFIEESHFYIKGDRIEKTGKDTYTADKASITSCSGLVPDWKISGKNIEVTLEGYGTLKHATLWAKKAPILYSPYLAFPVKTQRETGFLTPVLTHSTRKGFEYEQPLFLALSRSTDATIYLDYMEKRGIKTGLEYRYIFSEDSKGTLFYDFLHDRQTGDKDPDNKDYNYDATPDRTNSDRYWFRMKHDQIFPDHWSLKLDLDYVSDADYLREFDDGPSGFDKVAACFEDSFGRGLDDDYETIRENRLNINRIWSDYALNIEMNWQDNVTARQNNTEDTTLKTLPSILFSKLKQKSGTLPLYYNFDSELNYFYRKDTTQSLVRGSRADVYPRVHFPVKFSRFLSIEPSLGLRETLWLTDDYERLSRKEDSFHHREIYDLELELSTELSRIFNTYNWFADRIKHDIQPFIRYNYIPDTDQDDLPQFDTLDTIEKENIISWELVNRFTSRKKVFNKRSDKIEEVYREFARIKLSQAFDINREKDDMRHPFSDIFLESELTLNRFIVLEENIKWSPYDNCFTSNETGVMLNTPMGNVTTSYRYIKDTSESFYLSLVKMLTPEITAHAAIEKDFYKNELIESSAGITLRKQCWSLSMGIKNEPDDTSFAVMIELHGIGGFGSL
ncbi:MAG: LPS assembly protein LptD [Desulfobacteraceae bacterium]